MHPRISVSQISSFSWTIEQDLEFYAEEGIGTAGILFLKLEPDVPTGIEQIQRSGVQASWMVAGQMGAELIAPAPDQPSRALEILGPAIDAAAALGAPPCYFTSGSTPPRMPTDEAYDALVTALGPVSDHAAARGVPLAIENNSVTTRNNGFLHTLSDAVDLSRDTGIGIVLELQNAWMERNLAQMFKEHVDRFAVVQISDFVVGEDARLNRAVPGDGSVPLEWILERLLDAGYEGLFEIEVIGPRAEQEGYASAIRRSVAWLTERLEKWGV
jgi:sugar phosphate isomerase/epimerase